MRFTDPSNAPEQEQDNNYVNPKDLVGHLLLIWPIRYETDTFTKYPRQDGKPSDAVFCDVVVVSKKGDDGKPLVMRQTKWTQGRLIRDTKRFLGIADPLLKSMGKDGDAYILVDQVNNHVAVAMADAWEVENPGFQPGADAPAPSKAQETGGNWSEQQDPWQTGNQQQSSGVWPPQSEPAGMDEDAARRHAATERLRRQAANTPFPVSDSLPRPPQDETPPF